MADARSVITGSSVVVALLCAGWAIYATKHETPAGAASPMGMRGPGGGFGAVNAAPIQVVTAAAEMRSMQVGIEAIGTAVANEAVSVTSKTSNIVTAIHFSDGQNVRAGQVLVALDNAQARADLAAATADYTESASQYNRARDLVADQVLSQSQYDQLEATMKANQARLDAAEARVSDTVIRAPFSGRVGLRRVSVGTLISPGTVITTLDDVSSMKVDFSVPDIYVGQLHAGQTIIARTNAYVGREFRGQVTSIDSRIDPATRAVTVRATLPNQAGALRPGMFLTVELAKETRDALVIPEQALVPEQARQFVFRVSGDVVEKREVKLGRREPGRVEILDGLKNGDRIVIEGTLKLRDGAPVHEQAPSPVLVSPEGAPAGDRPT